MLFDNWEKLRCIRFEKITKYFVMHSIKFAKLTHNEINKIIDLPFKLCSSEFCFS